jgi:hypothetical protein
MWRVIVRSVGRIVKNEELWSKNKETIRKTFFSKDSIILWSWQTYALRKKQYLEIIEKKEFTHAEVLRFQTPRECENFLSEASESG